MSARTAAAMGDYAPRRANSKSLLMRMHKCRYIYLLMLPGLLYFVLFKYTPMWMLVIAFQRYSPFAGVMGSEWVGLANFRSLFQDAQFFRMLRNTLAINLLNLVFYFPLPIVLSLMLNEVKHERYKKSLQTVVYLPHFLSWVIVSSLTFFLLSVDVGLVNKLMRALGMKPYSFLSNPHIFWGILVGQTIWKETGWSTISFLAAISGVDVEQYEAATIDGASRMQRILNITLPAIAPTILTMLILRLGNIADVGFEQVLLMMNSMVNDVAEVFDTYSYRIGIQAGDASFGTTVSLFKGIVGLVFVYVSNKTVKKMGGDGIY